MWKDNGACIKYDTNTFFDLYEENPHIRGIVDEICLSCPVRRRCFAEAVTNKEWGVWGGVYLVDGKISSEYNDHKSARDWQETWMSLTVE